MKFIYFILGIFAFQFLVWGQMSPIAFWKKYSTTTTGATPSSATSSITGTGPVISDGVATSTITITLRDGSSAPIAGVVPTFNATDAGTTNIYSTCGATNASGVSTCTLASFVGQTKLLSLLTPIAFNGGTVVFTDLTPSISDASTGGLIADNFGVRSHTFLVGTDTFYASGKGALRYLVVGGGGPGYDWSPGMLSAYGGSAGEMVEGTLILTGPQSFSVNVGDSNIDSSFDVITAYANFYGIVYGYGGGGAGGYVDNRCVFSPNCYYNNDGGIGAMSNITGLDEYYSGGGGAGTQESNHNEAGRGGLGGGGAGAFLNTWLILTPPESGRYGSGGGGGGGFNGSPTGAPGGSGTVIVSYHYGVSTLVYPTGPSNVFYTNIPIQTIVPDLSGGTYSYPMTIYPDLPAGLIFNQSNGSISGTPTAISPSKSYTITAGNLGGGAHETITIEVKSSAGAAAHSSISGSTPIDADNYSKSTINILLKDASNSPMVGLVPTFKATNGGIENGNTYSPCTSTDASGNSYCSFYSNVAESKLLTLNELSLTGNSVVFNVPGPLTLHTSSGLGLSSGSLQKITPSKSFVFSRNNTFLFYLTGGVSPFTFTETHNDSVYYGSIDSYGNYYPPNSYPGTGYNPIIKIQDARGDIVYAYLSLVPNLSISPNILGAPALSSITFSGGDGVPPYTYSSTGTGTINSSTGAYIASSVPESDTVTVTDFLGNSASVTFSVYAPLTLPSTTLSMETSMSYLMSPSGGVPPYSYSLTGSGTIVLDSVNDPNSLHAAYNSDVVTDTPTVTVSDAVGNSIDAYFTILNVSQSLTCPNGTKRFTTGLLANTGTSTTWVVPAGITSITAKLWGAGGGAGGGDFGNNDSGGNGGGGGYAQAKLTTVPGETLTFKIGGAGKGASAATSGLAGASGAGGDLTAVLRGANYLLVAAGGGGGGGGGNNTSLAGRAGTAGWNGDLSLFIQPNSSGYPGVGCNGGIGYGAAGGAAGGTLGTGASGSLGDSVFGGGGGGGGGCLGGAGGSSNGNYGFGGEGGTNYLSGLLMLASSGTNNIVGQSTDPNYSFTVTGNVAITGKKITLSTGLNLSPGLTVSGTGIPAGNTISSVTSSTVLVLKTAPTANGSGVTITVSGFGNGGTGSFSSGSAGTSGEAYICY